MIAHRARDADPAGLGERETCSDVDGVAEEIVAINDDVADVDADAEPHLLAGGTSGIFTADRLLDRDGALLGLDGAGEIGDETVPGRVENEARWEAINRSTMTQ